MRLSEKLLGFLNRAFSKDPDAFLAFRLQYDGGMQWTVADGVLSTVVQGGSGGPLAIRLDGLTVRELCGQLSLAPGYATPYVAGSELSGAAALRLLDGRGDIRTSNGDHLLAYGSVLYAWIDTMAVELAAAEAAIAAMPAEMATTTADGTWLDFQGSFYDVRRSVGEGDEVYGLRIIAEVLRAKGNNVAIESAIATYTGQSAKITDVVIYRPSEPSFDGVTKFDGSRNFLPVTQPVYGLFDAVIGYDLINADLPTAYVATLRSIINRLRDAGTQLRDVALTGSVLSDAAALPTDEPDTLVVTHLRLWDGVRRFDGKFTFGGSTQDIGRISGALGTVPLVPDGLLLQVTIGGAPVPVTIDGQGGPVYAAGGTPAPG